MTELGNSLMHGDISIKPYEYEGRKPCEYCEFKNICAYEDGVDQVEKIKKVSLEEGKHALDQTTAEVIDQRDADILVSAAAGSGKTAVLVERIIQKITDEKHPIDVDHLLVVTFTKAAAGR